MPAMDATWSFLPAMLELQCQRPVCTWRFDIEFIINISKISRFLIDSDSITVKHQERLILKMNNAILIHSTLLEIFIKLTFTCAQLD